VRGLLLQTSQQTLSRVFSREEPDDELGFPEDDELGFPVGALRLRLRVDARRLVAVAVEPPDPLDDEQLEHCDDDFLKISQILRAVPRLPLYFGFLRSDGHFGLVVAGGCAASPTLNEPSVVQVSAWLGLHSVMPMLFSGAGRV